MNYGFAGDRDISVKVLKYLMFKGYRPKFLFVGNTKSTSHKEELIQISQLSEKDIYSNEDLKADNILTRLAQYEVDYIFGIHYPFIICKKLLDFPKIGFLNLHPAYLPYNKGWHTPTWAIYENSIYGATLHFMSESLDNGDIILQKEVKIDTEDTANSLYAKVLEKEFEVFKEALPSLLALKPKRLKQKGEGSTHCKKDIETIRKICIKSEVNALDLINKLRALTTNNINEAAYFEKDSEKYAIQISITKI